MPVRRRGFSGPAHAHGAAPWTTSSPTSSPSSASGALRAVAACGPALLTSLATRSDHSIVFLLWGGVARKTFNDLGILDAAKDAGTADRVAVVTHVHPGAEIAGRPSFFKPPNPFTFARDKLAAVGGPSIEW